MATEPGDRRLFSEIRHARAAAKGLHCPACGCNDLAVWYTRHKAGVIVRVRRCQHCGAKFTTYERAAGTPPPE